MKTKLAALAATAALSAAQTAAAATPAPACISEKEIAQLAIYSVPAMVEGVRAKCGPSLSSKGFLATRGAAFAASYAVLQGETWPSARSAITKFAAGKADAKDAQNFKLIAGLPDDAVRPLVDALIAQKVGESIKLGDCGKVERGIQLVSPLSPRDSGALLGFVFTLVKPDDATVCRS
ncbi:MAG: hypothetical protein ACTHKM_06605 [Tsuneonella sp.]